MEYPQDNLGTLDKLLANHFSEGFRFSGQRLLDLGRVSLSFVKGTPETYFIVSGIVSDNNTNYEAKISYRSANFVSQCTCILWTPELGCPHSASLLLKYKTLQNNNAEVEKANAPLTHSWVGVEGVHVDRYGTLVKSAPSLNGAKMSSSFSSLQYTLTNRKVVNFPGALNWRGQIKVNLVPATILDEYKDVLHIDEKYTYQVSYISPEDEETKEVSLFDVLYLFNWKTGIALDLPGELRDLGNKLRSLDVVQDIQEWVRILSSLHKKNSVQFFVEGKDWSDYPTEDIHYRFSIADSPRKSFLNLDLELFNEEEKLLPMPSPFLLFVGEQGWAGSFRTRNDALLFFKTLIEDFETETNLHRKYLHSASRKAIMMEWIDLVMKEHELSFFDPTFKKIFILKTKVFKKVFTAFLDCFQEVGLKSSFYHKDDRKIVFQIPKTNILEGISNFYQICTAMDIPIFYDQVQVKTWKSAIRFERNKMNLDWFELDLIVSDEDLEVIRKAEISDNFILSNKGLLLLSDEQKDLLRFMKRYTKLEGEKKEMGQKGLSRFGLFLQRARIFELFELKRLGIEGALTQEEEVFCEKILNLEDMPVYEIDDRYKDLARPYQLQGYQWLRFLYEHQFGACLADDMGLGKTLQTIMLLQTLKDKLKKVLIICPVSILYNWRNELEKFSDLSYAIYYGDERDFKTDAKVILTSYGLMKKESFSTFGDDVFDMVIFDEVQHLKNVRSLGASAARQIKAKFRICLTGTPVENDLSEFYNIMDLCVPGVWGDLGVIRSTSKNKNRLLARKTVKPFILRRTKEQVLKELPEKVENHVFLDFADEEKQFYHNKLDSVRSMMMTPGAKRYGDVLKSLLELRQLCLWQKQLALRSTKIDFLMENLETLVVEGHKTLVFSQFTTYLDLIQNKIQEQGWKFARIDGSQTIKKRGEMVEYFQNGDAQVFLISLKAGGFGLNLTAASYIFLMDPWWNPAVERQAIDRAHRIGQENKLTVYRPIIKESIEEKVLVLQQSKRELFKDLMAEDDDEYFNGKLNMDDFKHLLS